MLTIKLKNPAAVEVKSIKASKHANSTQVHNTALLSIGYDCDIKLEKKI